MEPLLDEDAKGGGNECNGGTQIPKSVDDDCDSRLISRLSINGNFVNSTTPDFTIPSFQIFGRRAA